jgi:hypothetical protein
MGRVVSLRPSHGGLGAPEARVPQNVIRRGLKISYERLAAIRRICLVAYGRVSPGSILAPIPPYSPYRSHDQLFLIRVVSGGCTGWGQACQQCTGGVASFKNLNCSSKHCTTDGSKALDVNVFVYCGVVQYVPLSYGVIRYLNAL